MNMQYIVLLLLACVQIILSVVLGYKRHSKVSRVFIYFTLALSLWTFANIIHGLSVDGLGEHNISLRLDLLNWSNQLGFFTGTITLGLLYYLVLVFPVERKITRLSRVIIGAGILVSLAALTPQVAGYYTLSSSTAEAHYVYGSLSLIVPLYYVLVAFTTVQTMVKVLRTTTDSKIKIQARTLLSSLLITGGLAVLIITILPLILGDDSFIFLGYFTPYIFTISLFYSILRQGFLDFKTLVARSVGYLVSILIILLLFVVSSTAAAQVLSGDGIGQGQTFAFAVLTVLLAVLFQPIKRFFDRITNTYFYKDAYDPQVFLDQLNWFLVSHSDLNKMLAESAQLIRDNFKSEFCLFRVPDPVNGKVSILVGSDAERFVTTDLATGVKLASKMNTNVIVADNLDASDAKLKGLLDKNDIAILVRLSPGHRQTSSSLGYIIIGAKRNGTFYTKQDINMCETLANGLTIALQNAYRFEEIKHFNETLQQKIEDATKELRSKNDRLRLLDQTKDDFISMASHQLRTPLTSVKGYISMVLDGDAGKITALQRKLLNQSFISSQRMVYLISDLLNVSRLRTGKFIIEPIETNLADVIESEVEQLKETAKSRELTLTYHKPEHFPLLMLDENKLRQVIMNFIDNAIYYTPSGGHITVKLEDRPNAIEFTVMDDGIGVPKHEQHHLFGKFYRAHNAKRARPDGTGLGLFMAKKVIIAQGGATVFKSQEGKGSTFGFTFPKHRLLPKPQVKTK